MNMNMKLHKAPSIRATRALQLLYGCCSRIGRIHVPRACVRLLFLSPSPFNALRAPLATKKKPHASTPPLCPSSPSSAPVKRKTPHASTPPLRPHRPPRSRMPPAASLLPSFHRSASPPPVPPPGAWRPSRKEEGSAEGGRGDGGRRGGRCRLSRRVGRACYGDRRRPIAAISSRGRSPRPRPRPQDLVAAWPVASHASVSASPAVTPPQPVSRALPAPGVSPPYAHGTALHRWPRRRGLMFFGWVCEPCPWPYTCAQRIGSASSARVCVPAQRAARPAVLYARTTDRLQCAYTPPML